MGDQKPLPEESFREALRDVVSIVQKLSKHCKDFNDLISVCSLAIEHDAQLSLLFSLMSSKSK